MSKRYSPAGAEIIGTLESVQGTAKIMEFNDDGTFEYAGETDVCWDSQESVLENGEKIFVDTDHNTWPESKIRKTKPRKKS